MEDLIGYLDEIQSQLTSPRKTGSKRGGDFGYKAEGAQRLPGNNANPLTMSKPENDDNAP
jgi:hypothetical protein